MTTYQKKIMEAIKANNQQNELLIEELKRLETAKKECYERTVILKNYIKKALIMVKFDTHMFCRIIYSLIHHTVLINDNHSNVRKEAMKNCTTLYLDAIMRIKTRRTAAAQHITHFIIDLFVDLVTIISFGNTKALSILNEIFETNDTSTYFIGFDFYKKHLDLFCKMEKFKEQKIPFAHITRQKKNTSLDYQIHITEIIQEFDKDNLDIANEFLAILCQTKYDKIIFGKTRYKRMPPATKKQKEAINKQIEIMEILKTISQKTPMTNIQTQALYDCEKISEREIQYDKKNETLKELTSLIEKLINLKIRLEPTQP
jgi:hypothetical protein